MTLVRGTGPESRTAALAVFVAVAWLEGGTFLHAQTTSASVFGSVQDSQGGVLPRASVALTSRTQAYTLTTASDTRGDFVFPIVRPDSYSLRVSLEGFKTL